MKENRILTKIFNKIKTWLGFGELPPGYYLETNGRQWRWVDKDGYTTIFSSRFRCFSVQDAWSWYRYRENKKKIVWKKEI